MCQKEDEGKIVHKTDFFFFFFIHMKYNGYCKVCDWGEKILKALLGFSFKYTFQLDIMSLPGMAPGLNRQ